MKQTHVDSGQQFEDLRRAAASQSKAAMVEGIAALVGMHGQLGAPVVEPSSTDGGAADLRHQAVSLPVPSLAQHRPGAATSTGKRKSGT